MDKKSKEKIDVRFPELHKFSELTANENNSLFQNGNAIFDFPDAFLAEFYELEQKRRYNLKWLIFTFAFALLGLIALFSAIIYVENISTDKALETGIVMAALLVFMIGSISGSVIYSDFKNSLKKIFIPTLIEKFYPGLNYEPYLHISADEIPGISKTQDNFIINRGEDYLSGQSDRLSFEICEVEMSNNNSANSTGFKGILVKIENLPFGLSAEKLTFEPQMKAAFENLSVFGKSEPYWLNGKTSGCVFLYIPSDKTFLEADAFSNILKKKSLNNCILQLESLFGLIKSLEKLSINE